MRSDSFSLYRAIAPVVVLLPLTGCSMVAPLVGRFERPLIQLDASKVEQLSPSDAQVRFALAVRNPNPYGLTVRRLTYRLTVNRVTMAKGSITQRVAVIAGGTATVSLTVHVPVGALFEAAGATMALGEIPYELDGSAAVGSFLQQRDIRFAVSSVLDLDLPLGLARRSQLRQIGRAG